MIDVYENFQLVPIREKDAWRICDFVNANEDRLKRWFPKTLEQNLTPSLSERFVNIKLKQWNQKKEFVFLLKKMEPKSMAGMAIIKNVRWERKQAELAYCIGYQFEGRHLMTRSVMALAEFAFKTLGLEILQIVTHESNLASVKVAEKSGFKFVTVLDNEFAPPGKSALDMLLYEKKING